jgi:hypothetical protein
MLQTILLVFSSLTVVALTVLVVMRDLSHKKEIQRLRVDLDHLRVEHGLTRTLLNEDAQKMREHLDED